MPTDDDPVFLYREIPTGADREFPKLAAKLVDETMRGIGAAVHKLTLDELVALFRKFPADDLAYLQGAIFQLLAMHVGKTEAELYTDWLVRAQADPDCHVVREFYGDGYPPVNPSASALLTDEQIRAATEARPPDFETLGVTVFCSRCGRPYNEHPHAFGEDSIIGNPHAFRTQRLPARYHRPEPWVWPDGRFESWRKPRS